MAAPSPPVERRPLRSWKEIAAHLEVDVRTVQRWHQQTDMPIYRRSVGARARVTAYTDELDRWLINRPESGIPPADVPSAPAQVDSPTVPRPRGRMLAAAGAIVLMTFALGVWLWPTPLLFRTEIANRTIRAFDESGRQLWSAPLPGTGESALPEGLADGDRTVVDDLTGDGRPDVVVRVVAPKEGGGTGHVLAFRHDGKPMWDRLLDMSRALNGRSEPPRYSAIVMRLVRRGAQAWILVAAGHRTSTSCPVLLLDPATGDIVDQYWHPGVLVSALAADLDGDGEPEAVLGGVSNPDGGLGYGALVVLPLPFARGPVKTGGLAAFTGGREQAYLLLPRPGLCTAQGEYPAVRDLNSENRRLQLRLGCNHASAFYTLGPDLALMDVRLSDRYAPLYADLRAKGLIDHPLEPDEIDCLRRVVKADVTVSPGSPDVSRAWQGCR